MLRGEGKRNLFKYALTALVKLTGIYTYATSVKVLGLEMAANLVVKLKRLPLHVAILITFPVNPICIFLLKCSKASLLTAS
jgi:hypothetical protein